MKDRNGKTIKAGDTINFTYGIPIVSVDAKIIIRKGRLIALTPGHNPEECFLSELKDYI